MIIFLLLMSGVLVIGPVIYLRSSGLVSVPDSFSILSNLASFVTIIWLALSLFFSQANNSRQLDVVQLQLAEMQKQSSLLAQQDRQNAVTAFISLHNQGMGVLDDTYHKIFSDAPQELLENGALKGNHGLSQWLKRVIASPSGTFVNAKIRLYCTQYEAIKKMSNLYGIEEGLLSVFFDGTDASKNYAIFKSLLR